MKTFKYEDYASDIEDAMEAHEPVIRFDTPDGELEVELEYGDLIPRSTGVSFNGDYETYLEPEWAEVGGATLYKRDGSYERACFI